VKRAISIITIYALTSVALNGKVMLIPAMEFKKRSYPFDLQIILPTFIFRKKELDAFLKYLYFVNFHYQGTLTISSLISIDYNSLLDELYRVYLKFWRDFENISVLPERRHLVEKKIIQWSKGLVKSPLSEFIYEYYSISEKSTDWQRKVSLWKSLKHRKKGNLPTSSRYKGKLKEKYIENWFNYMDKIELAPTIRSEFPLFFKAIKQLTFKELIQDLRICPACESELTDYSTDIKFCPFCGTSLIRQDTKPAEIEMKFCANCGAELRADIQFCPNCGTKIKK